MQNITRIRKIRCKRLLKTAIAAIIAFNVTALSGCGRDIRGTAQIDGIIQYASGLPVKDQNLEFCYRVEYMEDNPGLTNGTSTGYTPDECQAIQTDKIGHYTLRTNSIEIENVRVNRDFARLKKIHVWLKTTDGAPLSGDGIAGYALRILDLNLGGYTCEGRMCIISRTINFTVD